MRTFVSEADVAVIGLGAMGAATVYQLALRGVRVLGIDRWHPPHCHGSSHGGSRITREAVGEGEVYIPLVRRSHEIVSDLEKQFGQEFFVRSGTLMIASGNAHPGVSFLSTTIELARQFDISHQILTGAELKRAYPQFTTVQGADIGYLEPKAGYLKPEALIGAQLKAAEVYGASLWLGTQVTGVEPIGGKVAVTTDRGVVRAQRVVVAAGSWSRALLGSPFTKLLSVSRQTVHWFGLDGTISYAVKDIPVFLWFVSSKPEDYFAGFPTQYPQEGVKLITHEHTLDIDPDRAIRDVTETESVAFFERHVARNLKGVLPQVVKSASCFYTNTPDQGFIIDRHPASEAILAVSACSGHGFKHSLAIGEAIAQQLASGMSDVDLSPFSLGRFCKGAHCES